MVILKLKFWKVPEINCGFCFSWILPSFTRGHLTPLLPQWSQVCRNAGWGINSLGESLSPFKVVVSKKRKANSSHIALCPHVWINANFYVPNDLSYSERNLIGVSSCLRGETVSSLNGKLGPASWGERRYSFLEGLFSPIFMFFLYRAKRLW